MKPLPRKHLIGKFRQTIAENSLLGVINCLRSSASLTGANDGNAKREPTPIEFVRLKATKQSEWHHRESSIVIDLLAPFRGNGYGTEAINCGLFEVTNGVYQVRGFDISNMTLVEGKTGVIVLDVLASTECAAAALGFTAATAATDHGCGLGMAASSGTTIVVPPNDTIDATGDERIIDGVRLVFQMVPETEAPCEINVFFPDQRAVYIAECATHTMHNVITLRGAQVRDAKKWSKHLDETLDLYGHDSDVILSGHHWPTWGHENIVKFISNQRDLYGYMHDQTVRLMNKGMSGIEIAEQLQLPPSLQQEWYAGEYYGCLSQNVKGIYQRYMTWFDGNPANIWKHPPKEEGKRYVDCMGGVQAVLEKAKDNILTLRAAQLLTVYIYI
ncbi:Metallo-hydrolase/oxidoreductase [Thozetella sp. PMI_491]|nr:Metallo-hydrolase/oxidoreductase [Thozetella sp. PMI_491]